MTKIGCFWAFSHFFIFWGPFFGNFEPQSCFFIHDFSASQPSWSVKDEQNTTLQVRGQLSVISCQIVQLSDRTAVKSDNCQWTMDNCQRKLSVLWKNCKILQLSPTKLSVETVKQSWIYAVLLLSVGPVGPKGGIYPIMEDVLCRVNFWKIIWRTNNRRYMQFCLCLWALSGPEVGYIQLYMMLCAKSIFRNWFGGQTIVDICSCAFVCGPCRYFLNILCTQHTL